MANTTTTGWMSGARPLSDIREITEPSLFDSIHRMPVSDQSRKQNLNHAALSQRPSIDEECAPSLPHQHPIRPSKSRKDYQKFSVPKRIAPVQHQEDPFLSPPSDVEKATTYSIPTVVVPPRSSSKFANKENNVTLSPQAPNPKTPRDRSHQVINQRKLNSPIRTAEICSISNGPQGHPLPTKTIIKSKNNALYDVLDHPTHLHPRLKVSICLTAPLFVGGSSVEGFVRIFTDEPESSRRRKPLTLERACVDLLGVEDVSGAKRHIFLALANELINHSNPPLEDILDDSWNSWKSYRPGRSWILIPTITNLPFLLTLPLEVGPPPFDSKNAKIRYTLSATLTIKDDGRLLAVRSSQDVKVLSVYDPEKALVSLPSPLTASDEYMIQKGSKSENVILTAGLHRQVWVSGMDIFADVQIINNCHRTIKRIELQLERIILCYRHAAASTLEMSASGARLFDQLERTVVRKATVKRGMKGWEGVRSNSTDLRTCDLEIPRGHATVKCKKYFEVRYYLNIIAGTAHANLVRVQLPIILIHMSSLDVPTNSVAQVAAAIEEKREAEHARLRNEVSEGSPRMARRPSRNQIQGRAFSAPRKASSDRQRLQHEQFGRKIGVALSTQNSSQKPKLITINRGKELIPTSIPPVPRDRSLSLRGRDPTPYRNTSFSFRTPPSNRKGRLILDSDADELRRHFGHIRNSLSLGTNTSAQRSNRSVNTLPSRARSAMGRMNSTGLMPSEGRETLRYQRSLDLVPPPFRREYAKIAREKANR